MQKQFVFVGQNKDACFYVMIALGTDYGSILAPFWHQIGPKMASKSIKKVIEKLDAWLNDTLHASIMIGFMTRDSSSTK